MILKRLQNLWRLNKIMNKMMCSNMKQSGIKNEQQQNILDYQKIEQLNQQQKLKNKQKLIQLSKRIYPQFQKYQVNKKIKILYVFSLYQIRNQPLFKNIQDLISKKIPTLNNTSLLALLKTLYNFHKYYQKQVKIFKTIDFKFTSLSNFQFDQNTQSLFNILIKLKWPSSTMNKLFEKYLEKKQNSKKVLIKNLIIISEQSYLGMTIYKRIVQKIQELCVEQWNKFSKQQTLLLYYLSYSSFLNDRLQKIYKYNLAKNSINSLLGRQSYEEYLLKQKSQIKAKIDKILQNKHKAQQLIINKNYTISIQQGLLILQINNQLVRNKLENIFAQNILQTTVIQFVNYFQIFSKKQYFTKFYHFYQNRISTSQKIYILKKLSRFNQVVPFLKNKLIQILKIQHLVLNPIQFETLVKLAIIYNVDNEIITKFISNIQHQKLQ